MIWLGIDTANTPLSVAIVKDGEVMAEENSMMAINHSLRAMPAIEELFQKVGLAPSDIDAIAVSEGPGSYTGVRIGVTIAKTLAWTLNKPLTGVSSLKVLAANAIYFEGLICPMVDARRGNVYSAAYRVSDGELIDVIEDGHYPLNVLIQQLQQLDEPILFIGKDSRLHQDALNETFDERAIMAPVHYNPPRASSLIFIAEQQEETDVHHFVPEYCRLAEAEANWLKLQREEQNRD